MDMNLIELHSLRAITVKLQEYIKGTIITHKKYQYFKDEIKERIEYDKIMLKYVNEIRETIEDLMIQRKIKINRIKEMYEK